MTLDLEQLRGLPKVSLHDHLDGGLRPATIAELSAEIGHELPETDPEALGRWFRESADSGSLVRYLETFDHTVAVIQKPHYLRRIAREFVLDLAADGVVYGEIRWAPERCLEDGMSLTEAIESVRDGLADGMAEAASDGHEIIARQLLCSMRHEEPSTEIAELAVTYRDQGVAGFDIAGPEDGFPPDRFLAAFELLRRENAVFTIHAGEAAGPESIWSALQICGASRIGHGVRIVEDIRVDASAAGPSERDEDAGSAVRLGRLAAYVRDRRIPLELCPSSNVQTGAVKSLAEHPLPWLDDLGFTVTVNCDNRLMSGTSLTKEFGLLGSEFGYELADVARLTLNAAEAAFLPLPERTRLIEKVIRPAYAAAGVTLPA